MGIFYKSPVANTPVNVGGKNVCTLKSVYVSLIVPTQNLVFSAIKKTAMLKFRKPNTHKLALLALSKHAIFSRKT